MHVTLFSALALLAGCGGGEPEVEISAPREVAKPEVEADPALSTAERFGMRPAGEMPSPHGAMPPAMQGQSAAAEELFHFATPEGWTQVAPRQFRNPNFIIADNPDAQVYVTVLAGTGGGIEANLNRWREQMGQPPLSAEEFAALDTISFMGRPSPLLDLSGTFNGGMMMGGGGEPRPNWRLLGTAALIGDQAIFIKMTGPDEVIGNQHEALRQFSASLHPAAGHSH